MGPGDSFLGWGGKAAGALSLPLTPIYIDPKLRFSGAILPVQNCTPSPSYPFIVCAGTVFTFVMLCWNKSC